MKKDDTNQLWSKWNDCTLRLLQQAWGKPASPAPLWDTNGYQALVVQDTKPLQNPRHLWCPRCISSTSNQIVSDCQVQRSGIYKHIKHDMHLICIRCIHICPSGSIRTSPLPGDGQTGRPSWESACNGAITCECNHRFGKKTEKPIPLTDPHTLLKTAADAFVLARTA